MILFHRLLLKSKIIGRQIQHPIVVKDPAHELAALGVGEVHGDHVIWTMDFHNDVM